VVVTPDGGGPVELGKDDPVTFPGGMSCTVPSEARPGPLSEAWPWFLMGCLARGVLRLGRAGSAVGLPFPGFGRGPRPRSGRGGGPGGWRDPAGAVGVQGSRCQPGAGWGWVSAALNVNRRRP
jgi:hypothetical protein